MEKWLEFAPYDLLPDQNEKIFKQGRLESYMVPRDGNHTLRGQRQESAWKLIGEWLVGET